MYYLKKYWDFMRRDFGFRTFEKRVFTIAFAVALVFVLAHLSALALIVCGVGGWYLHKEYDLKVKVKKRAKPRAKKRI